MNETETRQNSEQLPTIWKKGSEATQFKSGEEAAYWGRIGGSTKSPARNKAAQLRELKKAGHSDKAIKKIYDFDDCGEFAEQTS
ncbi:hypothetical protein CCP3SC1AL1_2110011 [Gammaproteobacteria bacterium]